MSRRLVLALALVLPFLAGPAFAQAARTDVTIGMVLEPPHLDPTAGAAAAIDEVVYANVFEGLTRIGRNGEVLPALARSWEVSDDGLTYTFDLAPNVRFHDGTTFEADDVVFSFERAMADASENAQKGLFEAIEAVEAVDPATVRIRLKRPAGDLLFNLGWGDAVIVAPETADANRQTPVGTGPFRFGRWVKGSSLSLERNDDYWGDAPALARATFRFIPDPSAATAAMLAGDVDAFPNFPAPEALPIFQGDPCFTVRVGSTEGETILAMNKRRKPFDDVRVRKAIAHAINRDAVIQGAMFGLGTPIGTHFAPHHPAYLDLTDQSPFDPAKSRELLAEAGYANGFKATLKLPPPTYARRGGEIIAAQLRDVGIELEIVPVEWSVWLPEVFEGHDYDLTIVSHTEPMDIGIYGRDDYYFAMPTDGFPELMRELEGATDEATRYDVMQRMQNLIAGEAVNAFLFQLAKAGVWNAKLEGLWENAPIQANDLTGVRWTG